MNGTTKQVSYAKRLLKDAAAAWAGKTAEELAAAIGAPAYEQEAVRGWVKDMVDGETVNAASLHMVLTEYLADFSAGWVIDTCKNAYTNAMGHILRFWYCESGSRCAAPAFEEGVNYDMAHSCRLRYESGGVVREKLDGDTWKRLERVALTTPDWCCAMAYSLESGFARRSWEQETLRSPNYRRARATGMTARTRDLYAVLTALKERMRDGDNPLHG